MPTDADHSAHLGRLKQAAIDAVKLEESRHFVAAIVEESRSEATVVWLKTYAQYAPTPATRSAAVEGLTEHWPHHYNSFEIAYKCAIGDPFSPDDCDHVNPRAIAVAAIAKHYPDDHRTQSLLTDRATNDSDPQVRDLARQLLQARNGSH